MTPTNVLIIDDSKVITKLTAKALLSNKIANHFFHRNHIYIAHDGMQAFEILSQHPTISLVISDLIMPELSGEELIEMLIDTDKIKSLEVIFITSRINTNKLSKNIKNHIKGIIHKPFNDTTFSTLFNNMQEEYNKKIQNLKKIKFTHSKQIKYINTWLYSYCQEENITFCSKTLDPIIESEFNHHFEIDKDELFMIYQSIADIYTYNINNLHVLNNLLLQNIYNAWHDPEKYKEMGINEDFKKIISTAKTSLSNTSTRDDIKYLISLPINQLLIKMKNRAKTRQHLPYSDFAPYFDKLIDIFTEIDPKYQHTEIQPILNHINEIVKFQEHLNSLLSKSAVTEIFKNLDEIPHAIDIIRNYFDACIKHIEQNIIPLYVYKANQTAWQKAKKSPKIITYLKNNLKQKMITTHTLLHYNNIISRLDMKKFQKYDKDKILLFTKELEVLEVFKKNLSAKAPSLDISVFNNISIFKSELEKQKNAKMVVDLSFKTSIFNNGFQLLKFLRKKLPDIETIIQSENLYILVTPEQLEKLKQNKNSFNYKIILKPLNAEKIFEEIYLVN